ncbi:SIMPL domain-containing protein [Streptomyces sp. AV19]|uniref:SIMPL domain-containing protein n=1 Tax=Streptomyces sp. AV19 TaxID=2793068 RepID=UPI0018FED332|nr:SIMPL domain-containing protein [Streptomyces sp. AV19]MBH1936331.1 SIMPL domain-containing protein [Streptomyces sp. AV19]MDG4532368.1 SIMPL domain-containing protein [Streptomyces sp. AV19]
MTTPEPLPYGTPGTPRLAVRGEAHLEVEPEIARLGITISARGTDRHKALDDLTRRNNHVIDLLKSHGDAVEKIETSTITITPQLNDKGRHERIRAYRGHVHLAATLGDFTVLGELTTRLADLELTRLDGPWWDLRNDSPAHREARRRAVHDAVQRAREYAEALGSRLVALVELADTEAEHAGPMGPVPRPAAGAMRSAGYGGGAPATLDLEPQRQTVYAQVNARLTMTPPVL